MREGRRSKMETGKSKIARSPSTEKLGTSNLESDESDDTTRDALTLMKQNWKNETRGLGDKVEKGRVGLI